MTSRDVVSVIERAVRPLKVGHTGTLDPLAEGVLVIGVGPATRLTDYVQALPKGYLATFHLGQTTETDDAEGQCSAQVDTSDLSREIIEQELTRFCGQIQQVPPRFSAVHVEGRRAYALARSGKNFELAARTVEIHDLCLTRYDNPEIDVQVECGSGTYIRSLARDLGENLKCGAYMAALTRTHVGPFRLEDSLKLDSLPNRYGWDDLQQYLINPALAFAESQQWIANRQAVEDLQCGKTISSDGLTPVQLKPDASPAVSTICCVLNEQREMISVAEFCADTKQLRPRIVIPRNFLDARPH